MPTKQQQADDEIHEDQLLNFLVNVLTGAFSLELVNREHSTPSDVASGDVDLADHEVWVGLVRMIAWIYWVSKYCPSVPHLRIS